MFPNQMWKTAFVLASVFVLVIAAGTAVIFAMDDDSTGARQSYDTPAGACLEGTVDCDDNPAGGGAASGTCLAGAVKCGDNPAGGGVAGDAAGGTCMVGTPDCNDTPGAFRDDNRKG